MGSFKRSIKPPYKIKDYKISLKLCGLISKFANYPCNRMENLNIYSLIHTKLK